MNSFIDAKLEEQQICRPARCPNCCCKLDRKPNWVGLPAGVKFDPSDQELIEHLEKKVMTCDDDFKSHPLIDEFIPTIHGEDGICYTHPEKLPGVTKDGLSKHFFHRPSKAYTTGTRKRRKIQDSAAAETGSEIQHKGGGGETRWHKTGKTRPVMANGKQRGCKKILVLYTNFGKHRKPEKTNWVMHQYHLGELEEEKEGELVVSKVFYQTQPRQCSWSDRSAAPAPAAGEVSGSELLLLSSSSSKEAMNNPESFGFAPFSRKGFDEVGSLREATAPSTMARDDAEVADAAGSMSDQENENRRRMAPPHNDDMVHDNYHCRRWLVAAPTLRMAPTIPESAIFSPPTPIHQASTAFEGSVCNVSRLLLQADKFQQIRVQQQQQHQRVAERSASGLEELIMGCTSSGSNAETPLHSAEWLKFSSYWSPGNPDHHHHHHV